MTSADTQTLLSQALECHQAGRVADAEKLYSQLLQIEPAHPDALHLLGVLYQQTGHSTKSIELINRAIALRGDMPLYHNNLGSAYCSAQDFGSAVSSFKRAIELQEHYPHAHFNLGNAYKEQGLLAQAVESLKAAVQQEPSYIDAYKNLSTVYMKLYDYTSSLEILDKAFQLAPADFEVLNNRANTYMQMGAFDKARQCFNQAVSINPTNPTLRYNEALLSFMLTSATKWGDIIKHYDEHADAHVPYQYEMCVRSLMCCWLNKDQDAMEPLFISAEAHYGQLSSLPDSNTVNMRAYECYLQKLAKLPAVSLGDDLTGVVIGDSHALSYAALGDLKADVIVGCKAWHLAFAKDKKYRTAFERIISSVPKGTDCYFSFGEIDCRVGEGFIAQHKKHDIDLSASIKETVQAYVDYTSKQAAACSVVPVYMTVPAPNVSLLSLEKADQELLVQVIGVFNECLRKTAGRIVDLHKFTDTGDGTSNGARHIDAYHLNPSADLAILFKGK